MKRTLCLITCLFGLIACDESRPRKTSPIAVKSPPQPPSPIEVYRLDGVKKVFLHTPGAYSILYQGPNNELISTKVSDLPFIEERYSQGRKTPTRIFNDAPVGGMYLTIEYYNSYWFQIDIHVDSADTITGSPFRYKEGKAEKTGYTDDIR